MNELLAHAHMLNDFQKKLVTNLPSPLCNHVTLANINGKTLTLHTSSQAWASKLRFLTPELLNNAHTFCAPFKPKSIRIKVIPAEPEQNVARRKTEISDLSSKHIHNAANGISDPNLRAALLKLAQTNST